MAVDTVLTGVFLHSGQVCSAGTRLIVEESVADELVAGVVERARRIRFGNGLEDGVESGPLVSAQHRDKVEGYVALGLQEGARLLTGGRRPDAPELQRGFFFEPTVFDDCDRSMRIVQEETFGPILTVERFRTEEEAVFLGNDTTYGLAGAVQTLDVERGERVAAALRHGTVWINDFGPYVPEAEWGGQRMSATAGNSGPPVSRSTARPSTSGAPPGPRPRGGSRAEGRRAPTTSRNFEHHFEQTEARVEPSGGGTAASEDSHGLDEYGYKPGLERSIGSFASFAAGVSYISILTGTFQLFYFGYGTAGPSYLWSWPRCSSGSSWSLSASRNCRAATAWRVPSTTGPSASRRRPWPGRRAGRCSSPPS